MIQRTAHPALDLRLLRSLMAVARHGGVTAAADALGLTQPALSQHLRELAAQLGVPLFARVGRTLELTEAGRQLVQALEPVLEQLERVVAGAAAPRRQVTGILRVGAIHTYLSALVMPAVQALLAAHPELEVQVSEFSAAEVDRALLDGQIDLGLAFREHPGPRLADAVPKRIARTALFRETLALIAPAPRLPAPEPAMSPRELAALPLALLPRRFAMRRQLDAAAAAAGVQLHPRLEGPSVDALLRAVLGGNLYTVASPLALHVAGSRGGGFAGLAHLPLALPGFTRTAALHRRHGRPDGAAASAFVEMLGTAVAGAAAGGFVTSC
ncbi:hypothetical protein BKK81_18335 [Cupriavidus sp. USMAHM13]|uniref:LysR family transcriptional regulator n=1 Tax=Cupriavidus sp. USMAHM13 TaxID=1389192 RepID=UPI0008A6A277|nr:LysR substrate-binding domain-containing protein [Cupriavidus sp. USMAHM13]AOZ00985.1 hypothetical protein BKK81_18335 [Cupriavidus sp. USMAHM13]